MVNKKGLGEYDEEDEKANAVRAYFIVFSYFSVWVPMRHRYCGAKSSATFIPTLRLTKV